MKVTVIAIIVGTLETVPQGPRKDTVEGGGLEIKLRMKPFRPQHYENWLGYMENSWRYETCCHSDSSRKKPSELVCKKLFWSKIMMIENASHKII